MEDTQGQITIEKGNFFELPIDVSKELAQFSKMFISAEVDYFRLVHCCENKSRDYKVYGELSNGDKALLFTVRRHFDWCRCDYCGIYCICCAYLCCNQIVYQLDYKRNNVNFYTQGINLKKGCYCCRCICKCCPESLLYLRENAFPDNPDFEVGNKKGRTETTNPCCFCLKKNLTAKYITQEGYAGPVVSIPCSPICRDGCIFSLITYYTCFLSTLCCSRNYAHCYDLEMDIQDGFGNKTGSIIISNGCCSKKAAGTGVCYSPRGYFEINLPVNSTSLEKFQIIADVIHFDQIYNLI